MSPLRRHSPTKNNTTQRWQSRNRAQTSTPPLPSTPSSCLTLQIGTGKLSLRITTHKKTARHPYLAAPETLTQPTRRTLHEYPNHHQSIARLSSQTADYMYLWRTFSTTAPPLTAVCLSRKEHPVGGSPPPHRVRRRPHRHRPSGPAAAGGATAAAAAGAVGGVHT